MYVFLFYGLVSLLTAVGTIGYIVVNAVPASNLAFLF
jgi:hypothetical protein